MAQELKFKVLKEQVGKIQESLKTEQVSREIFDEKKTKEIRLVENLVNIEINKEK